MKRKGDIFYKIYDMNNLRLADKKASRGKSYQKSVIEYRKNKEINLLKLHFLFRNKEYKTSDYFHFQIMEDKIRDISKLPYFPDRIAQHAIANIVEPILSATFTSYTYGAIKKRGIHKASYALRNALKKDKYIEYCLKIDVKKFYPSINNEILKKLLRKKIKDKNVLNLLDEIIDSNIGLPLGNYLSQPLANFYLTYFDHFLKEECKVKYVFRYCDDICILSDNKPYLHNLLIIIRKYLSENLKLEVKGNHQVFPIEIRPIDFVGYPISRNHAKLRKRIKKNFARKLKRGCDYPTICSYKGWLKHCNGKNLEKKLLKNENR